MRNQVGITLMSLTIYLVIFLIVISIVATFTSFFYDNILNFDETTKTYSEINKFNMYFLQDIKEEGVQIANFIEDENKDKIGITLYNSNTYQTNVYKIEDNSIYRNGNLICKNINALKFKIDEKNSNIIDIYIETQGTVGMTKTMSYAINR